MTVNLRAASALLSLTLVKAYGDSWIETTNYHEENRTVWVVRHNGTIVHLGEVAHDPTGQLAFDLATSWVRTQIPDHTFNWKHHQVKPKSVRHQTASAIRRTG